MKSLKLWNKVPVRRSAPEHLTKESQTKRLRDATSIFSHLRKKQPKRNWTLWVPTAKTSTIGASHRSISIEARLTHRITDVRSRSLTEQVERRRREQSTDHWTSWRTMRNPSLICLGLKRGRNALSLLSETATWKSLTRILKSL